MTLVDMQLSFAFVMTYARGLFELVVEEIH